MQTGRRVAVYPSPYHSVTLSSRAYQLRYGLTSQLDHLSVDGKRWY